MSLFDVPMIWQSPAQRSEAAARKGAMYGATFQRAFEGAAGRKQQQRQFESGQAQRRQEFEATHGQRVREFESGHPLRDLQLKNEDLKRQVGQMNLQQMKDSIDDMRQLSADFMALQKNPKAIIDTSKYKSQAMLGRAIQLQDTMVKNSYNLRNKQAVTELYERASELPTSADFMRFNALMEKDIEAASAFLDSKVPKVKKSAGGVTIAVGDELAQREADIEQLKADASKETDPEKKKAMLSEAATKQRAFDISMNMIRKEEEPFLDRAFEQLGAKMVELGLADASDLEINPTTPNRKAITELLPKLKKAEALERLRKSGISGQRKMMADKKIELLFKELQSRIDMGDPSVTNEDGETDMAKVLQETKKIEDRMSVEGLPVPDYPSEATEPEGGGGFKGVIGRLFGKTSTEDDKQTLGQLLMESYKRRVNDARGNQ